MSKDNVLMCVRTKNYNNVLINECDLDVMMENLQVT